MIKIVFFAKYRERFGTDSVTVSQQGASSVGELMANLKRAFEDRVNFLDDQKLIISVNQQLASAASALHSGDVVAFYPPVTGG